MKTECWFKSLEKGFDEFVQELSAVPRVGEEIIAQAKYMFVQRVVHEVEQDRVVIYVGSRP